MLIHDGTVAGDIGHFSNIPLLDFFQNFGILFKLSVLFLYSRALTECTFAENGTRYQKLGRKSGCFESSKLKAEAVAAHVTRKIRMTLEMKLY